METEKIEQIDYTYLMFDGLYYKIGKSKNPKERLKSMLTGNPNCKLLCFGTGYSEDKMHNIFKKYRTGGEWFKLRFKEAELAKRMILGINIQGDLLRIAQIKKEGVIIKQENDYKIPLGKYKGISLKNMISDEHIRYLIWMQTWPNIERDNPKMFIMVNNHLQKHSDKFEHYSKFKGKNSQYKNNNVLK